MSTNETTDGKATARLEDEPAGNEIVYTRGAVVSSKRLYHTDPECPYVERADSTVEVPLGRLPDEARECDRCNHGNVSSSRGMTTECPVCGAEVKRLPYHLRNECDET